MTHRKFFITTTMDGRLIDSQIEYDIEDVITFISLLLDQYSDKMEKETDRVMSVEYEDEVFGTVRGELHGKPHEVTVRVKNGIR